MELKPGYKQTEVGVIPEDWRIAKLCTIADLATGNTPPTQDKSNYGGEFLFVSPADLNDSKWVYNTEKKLTKKGFSLARCFPKDSILFTCIGSTIGKTGMAACELTSNQQINAVFPNAKFSSEFLYYLLDLISPKIKILAAQQAVPIINKKEFGETLLPWPPTKAEQTAIANALSDADALIQSLTRLIAKKRQIKQGAMQTLLNPYENGRLKAGWMVKKLGNVATLKARIGWQGLTTAEYRETGDYFLITGTEFKNGFIDWESCFYVDFLRYKQDRNIQIKESDVLVTKDGTIGKVAFIKQLPKPGTLNSGVFVIRPIDESFHPEFFYYVLLSDIFDGFLSQLSAGSTINHLYQKDFVNFQFYVPKDNKEQTRIATILSDMDTEIAALEAKLAKYQHIKQGMMQNLLTGRIRLVKPASNTGAVA